MSLEQDFEYYLLNQKEFVKKYPGKYLLIHEEKLVNVFDNELDAYRDAQEQFEPGTFLIQPCLPGEESHTQTFYSRVGF